MLSCEETECWPACRCGIAVAFVGVVGLCLCEVALYACCEAVVIVFRVVFVVCTLVFVTGDGLVV